MLRKSYILLTFMLAVVFTSIARGRAILRHSISYSLILRATLVGM